MVLTLIVISALIFLAGALRTSKGRIGEHRVAHILGKLPKDRYRLINNLLLRTSSGGTTQIDHVVISEYGIFVIETKFYKGWIYGGERTSRAAKTKQTFQKTICCVTSFYPPSGIIYS